jgi:DNA topoisomerase-3
MKDSGIGTPATRAAIIERLIDVGYVERDGRALVCTEKGLNVIRLLDGHPLTSPGMTGDWEHRLTRIEQGEEKRERFMADIAEFARSTVSELDAKLKEVRIPRANLGPCPVCGHDIVENRKGFSCWSREDPGCGFVIWKSKAGKWRLEFDEPWAREGAKPPEREPAEAETPSTDAATPAEAA